MNKTILCFGLCALLFASACQKPAVLKSSAGKKMFWDFETAAIGSLPDGWLPAQSGTQLPSATWRVETDSWGNALALTRSTNTGQTFNLLLATGSSIGNLSLSARIRSVSGTESQSMGVVWRALDKDNFYFACLDLRERTLRTGCFEGGHSTPLRSIRVQIDPMKWQTLEVEHFRDGVRILLNGVVHMEFQNDTLRYPGMIGLMTIADSRAMFDDVRLQEIR